MHGQTLHFSTDAYWPKSPLLGHQACLSKCVVFTYVKPFVSQNRDIGLNLVFLYIEKRCLASSEQEAKMQRRKLWEGIACKWGLYSAQK